MSGIFKAITSLFAPADIPKSDVQAMPDPGSTAAKIAARAKIGKRQKNGRDGTIYGADGGGSRREGYNNSNLAGTATV